MPAKSKVAPAPVADKIGSKILVNVILDRSGSMASIRSQTISGYNEYIQGLRADKDTSYSVSLTQFDAPINVAELTVSYIDKPLAEVPELTRDSYIPRGNTPLYDAIGETIRRVDPIKAGRPVLCLIITDGYENASVEFTKDTIKALIKEKEAGGWTFSFLGANIDSYAVGGAIGTQTVNTANYAAQNIQGTLRQAAASTRAYSLNRRTTGACGQSVGEAFFDDEQREEMMDLTGKAPAAPPPVSKSDAKPRDWKVKEDK